MKRFFADALAVFVLPLKFVLFAAVPLLFTILVFYPIPFVADRIGKDKFFAGEGIHSPFVITISISLTLAAFVLVSCYRDFSRTQNRFAEFFTSRELRAVVLVTTALCGFVAFRFVSDYRAGNLELIGKDLSQIHYEWNHLVTDPLEHLDGECERCRLRAIGVPELFLK
jgi:hypothetical protein